MARKSNRRGRRPGRRPVLDAEVGPRKEQLSPELIGGAPRFEADNDRAPQASGGVRRGEALQVAEEEDDFEDGRSSGGITSRSQEDQWARGDVGSRAVETASGYLSIEGGEGELAEAVEPRSVEPPQRRSIKRERRSRRPGARGPSGRRASKTF